MNTLKTRPWILLGSLAVVGLAAGCSDDAQPFCGDGVAEGTEDCDLADLGGMTCDDMVPGTVGILLCDLDCTFNTAACSEPISCGDGVAEGTEDCDLADLGGATCADVVPGTSGTLGCTVDCVFDASACVLGQQCGNGVREFGEECDCGLNLTSLPPECTDVNGGVHANCDATCGSIDLCGDGLTTGAEECDCGDPAILATPPTDCLDFNGTVDATCDGSCHLVPECLYDPFEECTPLQGDPPTHGCCPDVWNNEYHCKSSPFTVGADNFCARTCSSAADCYWNDACLASISISFDMCFKAICDPGGPIVDAQLNGPCQTPGGQVGYCAPFDRYIDTLDFFGYCVENGSIAHGAVCPNVPLHGTDRYANGGAAGQMCNAGLCLGLPGQSGVCAAFCDWEAEYDAIILGSGAPFCPAGSNCLSESTISENQYHPQYADYGLRTSNLAYCRQTEAANPTDGLTTCSLVTGQLLVSTSQTCGDTHIQGICAPLAVQASYRTVACPNGPPDCTTPATCDTSPSSPDVGWCVVAGTELTFGSLIGRCMDGAAAGLAIWDPCNPASDLCPLGSWCEAENVFDDASGQARCIPFCDTQVHDGVGATCQDLGAPASTPGGTPVCTSMSYSYLPWTNGALSGPGGAADTYKSRLGLCALPRP